MPVSKNRMIISLNFKKALSKSDSFIRLRLYLKNFYRRELGRLENEGRLDHNSTFDADQGDKEFNKLVKRITKGLELDFFAPEEIIVRQDDEVKHYELDDLFKEDAFFYVIMTGNFKVTSC